MDSRIVRSHSHSKLALLTTKLQARFQRLPFQWTSGFTLTYRKLPPGVSPIGRSMTGHRQLADFKTLYSLRPAKRLWGSGSLVPLVFSSLSKYPVISDLDRCATSSFGIIQGTRSSVSSQSFTLRTRTKLDSACPGFTMTQKKAFISDK